MKKEDIGFILFLAGIVVIFLMFSADLFGVTGDPSAIGWKQLSGAGFGAAVLIAGILLIRAAKEKDE